MPVWELIPTCDDAMSCYTLIALFMFAVIGSGIGTIAYWWTSHEFKVVNKSVKEHDKYIVDTAVVINKMEVELAVQKSSLGEIKEDIADMKSDIRKDIAALQADIKQLLSR